MSSYDDARRRGQAAAYRARLRDMVRRAADRRRSETHYSRVTSELRNDREHPGIRWRCDCGWLAVGYTCPGCGRVPVWGQGA